ncbi:MAG: hypothetical protein OXF79_04820 [Chloroflexi bacterium]|nr:hypothetical protein [Chloroflexota bacterium]
MTRIPGADLATRVDSRTRLWRQGDIVELGAIAWLATPAAPLTIQSAAAEGDELSCIVAEASRLAIVSQTCDIVRDCQTRPFLLLAPTVVLEEPTAGEARRGSRPRFAQLPGIGEDTFVDLDRIVTIEKSLVMEAEPTRGLPDESSQRRFGLSVARAFSRFAFPDDLVISLRGLVARARDKHGRESHEGRALRGLEEIRVTGSPSWSALGIDVFVTFAPATREDAEEVMSEEEWDEVVDGWIRRTEPFGAIKSVDGAMIPLDELTAREYIDSDVLDLDYLSGEPETLG